MNYKHCQFFGCFAGVTLDVNARDVEM